MKQSKFYQIKNITEREYTLVGCDGSVITRPIQDVDKSASAFTIQDAKDGDVLYAKGSYFKEYLFMFSLLTEDNVISTHFGYDVFHGTFDKKLTRFGRKEDFMSVTPATKEQCDLLFQKMKEAGYEWDAEHKRLEKIEKKPIFDAEIPFGSKDSELEEVFYIIPNGFHAEIEDNKVIIKKGEQKPREKTEIYDSMDDLIADALIEEIEGSELDDRGKYNRIHWIKSHRQKHAWSEDDKYYYSIIQYCLNNERVGKADKESAISWFQSLKERAEKLFPELKVCTNEDIDMLNNIINDLTDRREMFKNNGDKAFAADTQYEIDWLEKLKQS